MTAPLKFLRYLPAEPLLAMFAEEMSNQQIAEQIGTTRNRIGKLRRPNAKITWIEADKFAIRMGSHPAYIWGDLWLCEVSPVEQKATA